MANRRGPGRIVLIASLLAGFPSLAEARPTRPDPLVAEAGCDRYRGVPIGANDSTQLFELSVCPTGEGVQGKVQTSSLVSGWSVRASKGSWDAGGRVLTLSETEFIESRPEPGWRFCLIDELVLEKTDKGLEGSYVSRACDDRAELVLEKLEPAGGSAAGTSQAPESSPPAPPIAPTQEQPREPIQEAGSGGCSCTSAASSRGEAALWCSLVLSMATARRRRHARFAQG